MAEYMVAKQSPDQWLVSKWEGGSLPSQIYTIRLSPDHKLSCNCPSGMYRGYCKHIDMVREELDENYQRRVG